MKTVRVTIRFGERDKRKRIRSVRFLREHDMAWKTGDCGCVMNTCKTFEILTSRIKLLTEGKL